MKNILSFVNRPLTGREIKAWVCFHTSHDTEYSKIARYMCRYLNIDDNSEYYLELDSPGSGCGEKIRYRPRVIKIKG